MSRLIAGNPHYVYERLHVAKEELLAPNRGDLIHRLHNTHTVLRALRRSDFPTKQMQRKFVGIMDDLTWNKSKTSSTDDVYTTLYLNDLLYVFDNVDLRDRIVLLYLEIDRMLRKGRGAFHV